MSKITFKGEISRYLKTTLLKFGALVTTVSAAMTLSSCDENQEKQIREEVNNEESKVVSIIDENNKANNEELLKRIKEGTATKEEIDTYMNNIATKDDINELKKLLETYLYAVTSPATTTVTTAYQTTNVTTKNTTTVTSKSASVPTIPSYVTKSSVPNETVPSTGTTTYTTTQTTPAQEVPYIVKDVIPSEFGDRNGYYVTNEYVVKGTQDLKDGTKGQTLWRIIYELLGDSKASNDEFRESVKRLNGIGDFVKEGTSIKIPGIGSIVYYNTKYMNSLDDIQTNTPIEEIKRMNSISNDTVLSEDTNLVVKVLDEKTKSFETVDGIAYIFGNSLIIAPNNSKFVECGETYNTGYNNSALLVQPTGKYTNECYLLFEKNGTYMGRIVARNVNPENTTSQLKNPILGINSEKIINKFAELGSQSKEHYKTVIYSFSEAYVYTSINNPEVICLTYNDFGDWAGMNKTTIFSGKQKTK